MFSVWENLEFRMGPTFDKSCNQFKIWTESILSLFFRTSQKFFLSPSLFLPNLDIIYWTFARLFFIPVLFFVTIEKGFDTERKKKLISLFFFPVETFKGSSFQEREKINQLNFINFKLY